MIFYALLPSTSYHGILNFVRHADTVVTYVTNGMPIRSNFKFPASVGKIAERNKADQNSKFRLFMKGQREPLASFLAGVSVRSNGTLSLCFLPHHFVYASKGSKHVQFSICFTCSVMEVDGTYSYHSAVNRVYLAKAEKLFAMRFDPKDPLPLPAKKKSENEVEISKGKG